MTGGPPDHARTPHHPLAPRVPGAWPREDGRTRFRVWAPHAGRVELHLLAPEERVLPMDREPDGWHAAEVQGAGPGTRYLYRLHRRRKPSDVERPDPASRAQPEGVHGPSEVVACREQDFPWTDAAWKGVAFEDLVLYELHVGAFTAPGTFEAVLPHLDHLRDLGVTMLELMPVAQFPGARNWGYDGVYPFAVQDSYGGQEGLRALVDACHAKGLGVCLDVVYNHLGPEGNYVQDFGPYFTERYHTPWGAALNFDGPGSDQVRDFFIAHALEMVTVHHIDALRLDAVHAILDGSARPFLTDLTEAVHRRAAALGRRVLVVAESAANDPRTVTPRALGGHGMDAQWTDDAHHALRAALTGEARGYYRDFAARTSGAHPLEWLALAWRHGFAYTGQRSLHFGRRQGAAPRPEDAHRMVAFAQNHDQVGNRMRGDRLAGQFPAGDAQGLETLKLAAAATLLSPFAPLLLMGEEWGAPEPFPYFVSHTDAALVEAVRKGRRAEFAHFGWEGEPPDPQDEATFRSAKLDHARREQAPHAALLELHRALLRMRRAHPALRHRDLRDLEALALARPPMLLGRRWAGPSRLGPEVAVLLHFGHEPAEARLPLPRGPWRRLLDTADKAWLGPGSAVPEELRSEGELTTSLKPRSAILLERSAGPEGAR